jgi:hypothetical protein
MQEQHNNSHEDHAENAIKEIAGEVTGTKKQGIEGNNPVDLERSQRIVVLSKKRSRLRVTAMADQ